MKTETDHTPLEESAFIKQHYIYNRYHTTQIGVYKFDPL